MSYDATPDQTDSGANGDEQWTIARYGTTVVVNVNDETDDTEWVTEAEAATEYQDTLDTLRAAGQN